MTEISTAGTSPEDAAGRPRRALVIGLDGATAALLDRWLEAGLMPHLQRLAAEGTRAALHSVVPPFPAPASASLLTGVRPALHGVFDSGRRVHSRVPAVWSLLADAGLRIGLVNVPLSHPPPEAAAFVVPGPSAPLPVAGCTRPRGLLAQPRRECGGYVAQMPQPRGGTAKAMARFLTEMEHATRQQARCARYLLTTREWDCCLVSFPALDCLQRWLWDVVARAPSSSGSEEELHARAEALVRELDRWLGELSAACGPAADVLIVSAHEGGPAPWRFRVNQWLAECGLLTPARSPAGAFSRVWRSLRARADGASFPRAIDWSQTRAYVGSPDDCGIRINLRGREAEGVVAPGAESEEVRTRVLEQLQELRHPEGDAPLFAAALRREELSDGLAASEAPDIICLLGEGALTLDLQLGGPLFARAARGDPVGTHRPGGLLIAHGPHVRSGGRLDGMGLVDLVPALLRLFGVIAPDHLEGRVPEGLLTREAEATPMGPPRRPGLAGADPYTDEEARQVAERLRGLGYL